MKSLSTYPIISITIFLILGIVTYDVFPFSYTSLIVGLGLFVLLAVFLHFWQIKKIRRTPFFYVSVILISFLLGQLTAYHHDAKQDKKHYSRIVNVKPTHIWQVSIEKRLKSSSYYHHYIARVVSLDKQPVNGQVLIKQPASGTQFLLQTNLIFIADSLGVRQIEKVKNPYSFDYRKFMQRQQIFHQVNLKRVAYQSMPDHRFSLLKLSAQIREYFKDYFQSLDLDTQAYQLAIALFLGERQDLSKEVYRNFQAAGSVHILAISGLHIGILLLFLNFIFKPVQKKNTLLFLLLSLGFLWFYAFITGFSPSVLRAVIMFSFLQIGLQSKRKSNVYNSLFLAALFMLLMNPYNLYRLGFQMSFLAVLAIVTFFPVFQKMFRVKNKILKWLVELFWVSLSAQLGVLPLTLFYFHQFPVYFFLTNMISIPLLFVVLFVGFSLMLISPLGLHISFVNEGFNFLLNSLLRTNQLIADLPGALLSHIHFTTGMMWLAFLGLWVLYRLLRNPKKYTSYLQAGIFILFVQIFVLWQKYASTQEQTYYVLHQYQVPVNAVSSGKDLLIFQDSAKVNTYLLNAFYNHFDNIRFQKPVFTQNFAGKQILHIDSLGIYNYKTIRPQIVVLHDNPKINVDRMIETLQPSILLVDASNYSFYKSLWQQSAAKYGIRFYDISREGAFVLKNEKVEMLKK